MIVAIDGPAASGKTTVARRLAARLGFGVLPSGATYRALAWAALQRNLSPEDADALIRLADEVTIDITGRPEAVRVTVDGEDVSEAIGSVEVANAASRLSRHPQVRDRLVRLQRAIAGRLGDVVAEGRDMTTVVFADAPVKVYLDASMAERARRRHAELAALGRAAHLSLPAIEADLAARDRQDTTRAAAPLTRAPGADYLDTTDLSVEAVVDRLVERVSRVT
jgi:cytidylate kinase